MEGRARAGLRPGSAAAIDKHYAGDDSDVQVLMGGTLQAFGGMKMKDYARATVFLRGPHPTLGRAYRHCGYPPMIELLATSRLNRLLDLHRLRRRPGLHAAGHRRIYGIPEERVIGSSNALGYQPGRTRGKTGLSSTKPDVFDDGPSKPVRIWGRVGRRPILWGNSNGDIPMLRYRAAQASGLRLLLLHDDPRSASSPTRRAPKGVRAAAQPTGGPWPASRTTGNRLPGAVSAAFIPPVGARADQCERECALEVTHAQRLRLL